VKLVSEYRCFGGKQRVYVHDATETRCPMRFGLFLPPQAESSRVPVLFWLSGLTCTEENFITKAGAQRVAAELGLALVVPDTSPRGLGYPGEADHYDFGLGAGFYVDATREPWAKGYRMYSYVARELWDLVGSRFPLDSTRAGIFGHSMGGHGALVIGLRNPAQFRSLSAFAPISSPTRCAWGEKAFAGYLAEGRDSWGEYDASVLIASRGWPGGTIRVDQGEQDSFLEKQLRPDLLINACRRSGVSLDLRMQPGYDHSYYFIATFMEEHLRFHARNLGVG